VLSPRRTPRRSRRPPSRGCWSRSQPCVSTW
jgi:hypothetical protein